MGYFAHTVEEIVKLNEKALKLVKNTTFDSIRVAKDCISIRSSMSKEDFRRLAVDNFSVTPQADSDLWYFKVDDIFFCNIEYEHDKETKIDSIKEIISVAKETKELVSREFPVIELGVTVILDKVTAKKEPLSKVFDDFNEVAPNTYVAEKDHTIFTVRFAE